MHHSGLHPQNNSLPFFGFPSSMFSQKNLLFPLEFILGVLFCGTVWLAVPGGKQDILWVMFTVISLCLLFAVFSYTFDLRVADVATSIKS